MFASRELLKELKLDIEKDREPGLKDYILVIRKRFWLIAVIFVVVVTATAIFSFKATRIYRATALLRIEKKVPKIIALDESSPVEIFRDEYYETQYKLIKSRKICSRVYENLDLDNNMRYSGRSDPVGAFCDDILVTPIVDTYLVNVSYESENPELAADITNAIVDEYIAQAKEEKRQISEEAESKLNEEIPILRRNLKESEEALRSFEEENSAQSFEKRREIIYDTLSTLNAQHTKAEQELAGVKARYESVSGAETPEDMLSLPDVVNSLVIQKYMQDKLSLETEKAELLHTYKPESDPVKAVQKKIDVIEEKITAESTRIVTSVEKELQEKISERDNLKELLDKHEQTVRAFDRNMGRHTELKGEVEASRLIYDDYIQKYKKIQSSSRFDFSTVQIVDRAETPTTPVSPRKMLNIFAAAVVSLLGAGALAFLLEYLDDSIKGHDDIEKYLQLPLLGIVPSTRSNGKDIRDKDLVTQNKPKSEISEAYRSIRTSLLYASSNQEPKAYVITSAGPREGKTTTAINLAISFAHSGKKALLVDSDLRKPRIHKTFEKSNEKGLTNCLAGQSNVADVVEKTDIDNLSLVTSGPIPPNPAELLGSPRMSEILKNMKNTYDIVIFDSPPLVAVTDAALLSSMTDGAIQVVWAGNTSRKVAVHGKEKVESIGAKLVGVILNNMRMSRTGYYYYYPRYYKYYGKQNKSSS